MLTTTQERIWDELNQCELELNFPDLPEDIKKSVEQTISRNIPHCLDPAKAKGHCLRISNELMLTLADAGRQPFIDCKIVFTKVPQSHFWIMVDGWHIDLTARQFNAHEACPKIWKREPAYDRGLYSVEKGKGLVLFRLEPLYATKRSFPALRRLYAKLKSLLRPVLKPTRESASRWPGRENSFR